MKALRKISLTVVLMLIGVFISNGEVVGDEILKIGSVVQLSGPAAAWGLGGTNTIDIWAEKVNAGGGLGIGGKVYRIKTIAYDHKISVSEATTLTNRIVYNDEVKYIMHSMIGLTVLAMQTITEPNKIFLNTCAGGKNILGPDKPYTFRAAMDEYIYSEIAWNWIAKKYPKVKSVALINPNDSSGWAYKDAIEAVCKRLRIEVVANKLYDRGTTDFAPIVTSMLAKRPDAISLGGSSPGDGALVLKEAYSQGYKGLKELGFVSEIVTLMKIAGAEAVEGCIGTLANDYESPLMPKGVRDLATIYKAKYNDLMPATAREPLIMLEMLTKAWQKTGTVDVDRNIAELEKMGKIETTFGPAILGGKEFYGINRQLFRTSYVSTIKNGKFIMLEEVLPALLR